MHARPLVVAASLSLALASCATGGRTPVPVTPVAGEAPPEEFKPMGEVQVVGMGTASSSSASFDDWRVAGPRVNVVRLDATTWAGHIVDRDVRLQVRDGRILGAGVTIAVERSGEVLEIGGVIGVFRLRFEVTPRHVRGSFGRRSFELGATGPGRYVGNGRVLQLTGTAADLSAVPMPQLAIALIAATSE